ncbi:phage tail tape measure protein [Dysgonomonas termitidis]|uniref:Phage tail tape measure protein n=1 Tax=Dysgonomonas termitidis TaxID=1516126 RepID=A0ABV9KRL2_9BACT
MANRTGTYNARIYIDGVAVENSVKGIKEKMRELTNQQALMIKGSDQYIAHTKKIAQLENILQEHKDYQKEIVKEYGNMDKAADDFGKKSKKSFAGALQVFAGNMLTKGVQFLSRSLGDTVNKIRSFEKANVVLAGILGVNKNEIKDLSSSAIELGKNSKYTASQVTELQTELAKLGFSKQEIKDSQKYVLDFATALGAELGDAAALAGASLRAFGAETTETERYVSAMTVAANKSALSFEYLSTAMPIVAPVAKAFNFTIEDTLALLGKLSDSGFDASSAATSLRNIFLNLADSNGKLAKALGHPVKNLDDLVKGFQDLKAKGIDLASALELTDKRSVAAFQTFLQGAEKIKPLRDSLIGVGDQLDKLAKDQMDNLDGSVLSLQSKWETLMLSFSNSSGPMKTVVDWLGNIVEGFTNIIDKMNKLQDRPAYKSFLDIEKNRETDKSYLKLRQSINYKDLNSLDGNERAGAETVLKRAYDKERQEIEKNISLFTEQQEAAQKKLDETIEKNKGVERFIPLYNLGMATEESDLEKDLESITTKADIAKVSMEALNDAYKEILKEDKTTPGDTNKKFKLPDDNKKNKDNASKEQKKVQDALKKLEEDNYKELTRIKENYLNGSLDDEAEYNKALLIQQDAYDKLRKDRLQALLKETTDPSIRIDIEKKIAEIEAKALDKQIADKVKKQKDAAKQEQDRLKQGQDLLKWNEEETKKILESAFQYVATEEDKAYIKQMERRARGEISEAEYQKEITAIQMKYLEERLRINGASEEQIADIRKQTLEQEINTLQDNESRRNTLLGGLGTQLADKMKEIDDALLNGAVTFGEAVMMRVEAYMDMVNSAMQDITGNLSNTWANYASVEESQISRKYDKEIKAAEGNSKKQKKLEEKKQKELNAIKAKYADKQFAVTVAQTISTTALAAMEAYKAMAGIPVIGPALGVAAAGAAIAYGKSQIDVAKEQRDAAKEGYYKGGYYINEGYTGGNDPRQIRGFLPDGSPVHGEEFIANHTTTSLYRPLFDLFNEAQKHNTVSSISKADLAKALNIPTGYYSGGYNGKPSAVQTVVRDNRYDESYDRFVTVMERLEERLNVPFTGIVTYKGEGGIEEAEKLDKKMMKNV